MPGTEVSQRAVPHWVLVPVIFLEMVLPPEPWPLSHVNSSAPVIFSHTIGAPLGTPFSSLSIGTLHQHAFPYIADTPKILSSSIHLLYSPQSTLEVQTCSMNPNSTRPPCRHSIQPYRTPCSTDSLYVPIQQPPQCRSPQQVTPQGAGTSNAPKQYTYIVQTLHLSHVICCMS